MQASEEYQSVALPLIDTFLGKTNSDTILAICDLIKHNLEGIGAAVQAYERAMKEVLEYRRSKGPSELWGVPIE